MLNGMDSARKKEFILEDPRSYKFLANGNLGVNDSQDFQDTVNAMSIMGISDEDQNGKEERRDARVHFQNRAIRKGVVIRRKE